MWFAEQLNSFLNLGECKEYPIMARSKSISGGKADRTSIEQTSTGNPANAPDVNAVAAEKAATQIAPEPKTTPEPRKLEVMKTEVMKTEPRKNVVPIKLEDEIRRRAYELYLQRGTGSGSEAEDWLAAEREIRQRYRQQSA
jgi:Protein of unknown function (DUF2934)